MADVPTQVVKAWNSQWELFTYKPIIIINQVDYLEIEYYFLLISYVRKFENFQSLIL